MKFYSNNKRKMKTQKKHSNAPLRTSRNFELSPIDIEKPTQDSQTVPDMTPDLRTLLQKRQNGQLVPVLDGQYTDVDIPDIELMDAVELLQYRMEVADEMQHLQELHHKYSKELEKRHNDADFQSKLQEAIEKHKTDSALNAEQP